MRSRIVLLTCLAVVMAAWTALAAGTVETRTFHSQALDLDKTVQVYLPEGYATSGVEYPVVYFIHGMTSSYLGDADVVEAAEDVMEAGWIQPFILVKPDAHCMPFADAGFAVPVHTSLTNSELNGDFEDYFVIDLVGWVDATYRTVADRDHRFVTGHSQGGYSAMRAALRHPEVFSKVGSHAGALTMEPMAAFGPMIAPEYPDGPPYDYRPDAGFISKIVFAYAASFTPNLENPPWFVDLAFDGYGQPDPEVWPRFVAHSNTVFAAEFAASGADLDIFLECGTLDELGANYLNQYFAGVLDNLGVPYTMRWFVGDHHDHLALRMPIQLSHFLPLAATAESPSPVFNPRRWWPIQDFALELPLAGLGAASIDPGTVAITAIDGIELAAPLYPVGVFDLSDVNGNDAQDLTVRFWVEQLAQAMRDAGVEVPAEVAVTLRGETFDELFWAATETLQVPTLDEPPRQRQNRPGAED